MGTDPSFQGGYKASDGRWYSTDGRFVWDGARWRPHQGDPHWKRLELAVADAYRRQGYAVEVTGGESAGDGGVDLVLRNEGRTTLVQVKNWWRGEPVGVEKVRELWGLVAMRGAQAAVFITRSDFTVEAYQEAARCPGLQLINRVGLAGLLASVPGAAELLAPPPPAPRGETIPVQPILSAARPNVGSRRSRSYRRSVASPLAGLVALVLIVLFFSCGGLQSLVPKSQSATLALSPSNSHSVLSATEASKEVRSWWTGQESLEMAPDPAGVDRLFAGVAAEAASKKYESLKAQQKRSLGARTVASVDIFLPAQAAYPVWFAAAVSFHPVDANGASLPYSSLPMSIVFEKVALIIAPKATWYETSGSPFPKATGNSLVAKPSSISLMSGREVPTAYVDFLTRTITQSQSPSDVDPFARPNYKYVGLTATAGSVLPVPGSPLSFSLPSDAQTYALPLADGGELVLFALIRAATYRAGPTCLIQPSTLSAFGPSLPAGKYQTVTADAVLMAVASVPPKNPPANSGVPRIDMAGEIDTGDVAGTPPSGCK